jgi:hypothetical protein
MALRPALTSSLPLSVLKEHHRVTCKTFVFHSKRSARKCNDISHTRNVKSVSHHVGQNIHIITTANKHINCHAGLDPAFRPMLDSRFRGNDGFDLYYCRRINQNYREPLQHQHDTRGDKFFLITHFTGNVDAGLEHHESR